MENQVIIRKIGSQQIMRSLVPGILGFCIVGVSLAAQAEEVQFSAQVDQNQISMSDSLSLSLIIRSSSNLRISDPQYRAPGFDLLHEFSSVSVSSNYNMNAGKFTTTNQHQLTKVLRPLKPGMQRITQIEVTVGGKVYRAPDITIQVSPQGKTPNRPMQPQLGGDRRQRITGNQVFVKAEVEKDTAFKGEQLIVSYYLYHQTKVFNLQVDRFPVLNGFLREDLELPVLGHRLESEPVTVNGQPFERALLARYAAYPLQEGNLAIDSIGLKYNYYDRTQNGNVDEEDPFFGFFQQLTPKAGKSQSDRLTIHVLPLPASDRPASFIGGVGRFEVTSAVDRYELRANEALHLTVKVEGQGNVTTLQEPKIQLPENLELYDKKSRLNRGRGGSGEKIYEYVIIPRKPGKTEVPSIDFGFFDPNKKEYYVKRTEPIQLNVLEPAPGTLSVPTESRPSEVKVGKDRNPPQQKPVLRPLKSPIEANPSHGFWVPAWRLLYWACSAAFCVLLALVGMDFLKRKMNWLALGSSSKDNPAEGWQALHKIADHANQGAPLQTVIEAYDQISHRILDSLDHVFQLGAKSISRDELKQKLLSESLLSPAIWEKVEKTLEYTDWVRFAGRTSPTSETEIRSQLPTWLQEAKTAVQQIRNHSIKLD